MDVAVKFCGLTRPEDARRAAELGAGYLGVIFAGGPRKLDPSRARVVLDGGILGGGATGARRVGVFGAQTADEIARTADAAGLDIVQLHGDPDASTVRGVRQRTGREVWGVLRVAGTELPPDAAMLFEEADAVVLDAKVAGRLGGTGVALDWAGLAESLARRPAHSRFVLAGGLTAHNVVEALQVLAPDVVDVSSGVESTAGVKDHHRMNAFAAAVASAAALPGASRAEVQP